MAFRGWPDQALEFFEGLEEDNSKAYWTAHKTVYDEEVRAPMEELVAELARQRIEVSGHERVKTVPRGYPRDHPRAELLRNKGIAAFKQWPVASWLGTAAAKKRVEDFFVSARPLADWLASHVGPSTVDSGR